MSVFIYADVAAVQNFVEIAAYMRSTASAC